MLIPIGCGAMGVGSATSVPACRVRIASVTVMNSGGGNFDLELKIRTMRKSNFLGHFRRKTFFARGHCRNRLIVSHVIREKM